MFDNDFDFQGDISGDIEMFERYLKDGEMSYIDADRLEAMVDHYLVSNQFNKALKCCDYALSMFSFENIFQIRKAQALSALGDLKEGLRVLGWLEKQGLMDCEIWLTKASIFSQLKDSKKAIKYFEFALDLANPEDQDEIYLDIAMEYENLNDYAKAIEILKTALQNNPQNEFALYELGQCYEQINDTASAIKSYLDYIDENPYSYTAWYNLGNAYHKIEDYDKAIWAYDYCLLIQPDFGPAHFNMGNAYFSIEKYRSSVEHFQACLENDGEDPLTLCYLGEAYEQLNELPLAKMHFQKAIDLSPDMIDAWIGLGVVFDLEDKTFEALTFFIKAIEIDPKNADAHHVLGAAYEKLGESELALEYFLKAIELSPEDQEILSDLMTLHLELDALAALQFIMSYNDTFEAELNVTAWQISAYYFLGRKKDALYLLENWFSMDPTAANQLFEINPDLKSNKEFAKFL